MTKANLVAVGFCAQMTEIGDWAFEFALDLARRHDAQLDIFVFPTPPSDGHPPRGRKGERAELSDDDAIGTEKKMRLYYDALLGDYLKVGFRLCPGDEAPELRRCLFGRQFDVLVLPYEKRSGLFGERTIEDFAERMQCPVVLVGPDAADEIHINRPACLWLTELGLEDRAWTQARAETPAR